MEEQFWHDRWEAKQIGFHEPAANPRLTGNIGALGLAAGARIFVPLCGKSLDMHWLLAQGFQVAGAELSPIAVGELFDELGIAPVVTTEGSLQRYSAQGITIFAGNIFDLDAGMLGVVDAVYDRAALVALPEAMRTQYARHLMVVTGKAPQLLVTFVYDQAVMDGPPFSVSPTEVERLYGTDYSLERLEHVPVAGGIRGVCPADEIVWRLSPSS